MRTDQIHASAVAVDGQGCLILGAPGAGKSGLALQLIALGAELIADDRVDLVVEKGGLFLSSPPGIRDLIEARGIGLIKVCANPEPVLCKVVVDLDQSTERLPSLRMRDLLGISCPVILGKTAPNLASAVIVLLRSGKLRDPDHGV
ncbi:MAG: serine kinase [Pseudomonadota bacterium]